MALCHRCCYKDEKNQTGASRKGQSDARSVRPGSAERLERHGKATTPGESALTKPQTTARTTSKPGNTLVQVRACALLRPSTLPTEITLQKVLPFLSYLDVNGDPRHCTAIRMTGIR